MKNIKIQIYNNLSINEGGKRTNVYNDFINVFNFISESNSHNTCKGLNSFTEGILISWWRE